MTTDPNRTLKTSHSGRRAAAARDGRAAKGNAPTEPIIPIDQPVGAKAASEAMRSLIAEAQRILDTAAGLEYDAKHGRCNAWQAASKITSAAATLLGVLRVVALAVLLTLGAAAATPLEQLDADLQAARTAQADAEHAAYARLLTTSKLAPLPIADLPPDPRASELARHEQLAAVNKQVRELAELRDLPGGFTVRQVRAVLKPDVLADYFAIRNADEAAAHAPADAPKPAAPAPKHPPTGEIVKPTR